MEKIVLILQKSCATGCIYYNY